MLFADGLQASVLPKRVEPFVEPSDDTRFRRVAHEGEAEVETTDLPVAANSTVVSNESFKITSLDPDYSDPDGTFQTMQVFQELA